MGVMTQAELTAEVTRRINRTDLSTDIAVWLYRAILDLTTYRLFFENEKSVTLTQSVGQNTLTIPVDFLFPIRMEWSDGEMYYNCRFKDLIYVRELYHGGSTGRPDFVARFGGTFFFDRNGDQQYDWTLYYKYVMPDFAGADLTSPISGHWDEALVRHATHNAYATLRQWELADYHLKSYYAYVKGRLGNLEQTEGAWNESFMGDIDDDPYSF